MQFLLQLYNNFKRAIKYNCRLLGFTVPKLPKPSYFFLKRTFVAPTLKKPEEATGESLIFLQWKYSGRILRFSFGQTVNPNNWNTKTESVKQKLTTTKDGQYNLNELLKSLKDLCILTYNKNLKGGIPSPETIKVALKEFVYGEEIQPVYKITFYSLLEDFMNNNIPFDGGKKSSNTVKCYKTLYNHLRNFEKATGYKIGFETIRIDFIEKYKTFIKSKGYSHNFLTKHIKSIRAVMNRATAMGYTNNYEYKREAFAMSYKEVDAVYLTNEEVECLFSYDFSNDKRLERTRDLFVVGCLTGLRFSDFSNIKREHIFLRNDGTYIQIQTAKTNEGVIIPCDEMILNIFERYNHNRNRLPRSLSNQKFNEYIKEVCKKAGLKEKGRLLNEPGKELYQCVSSHTCRRSFATNLYLEGFSAIDIMKITGHRTEKAFMTYIKISKIEVAKRLNAHLMARRKNHHLKVTS
jgi:integrase